ncbi:MAG: GNAT family N-acetyltransferase [Lautropia sp.]
MTGTRPAWTDVPLERQHDRAGFDCGQPDLNAYLARFARQDHERGISRTFVVLDEDQRTIHGFYTLSPAQIDQAKAPEAVRRQAGRYPIGGYRLGRLAVSRALQGRGLGGELLIAAARRCIRVSTEVGGQVLVIDAKDDAAAAWYGRFGALALLDAPLTLVMPYALFAKALEATGPASSTTHG